MFDLIPDPAKVSKILLFCGLDELHLRNVVDNARRRFPGAEIVNCIAATLSKRDRDELDAQALFLGPLTMRSIPSIRNRLREENPDLSIVVFDNKDGKGALRRGYLALTIGASRVVTVDSLLRAAFYGWLPLLRQVIQVFIINKLAYLIYLPLLKGLYGLVALATWAAPLIRFIRKLFPGGRREEGFSVLAFPYYSKENIGEEYRLYKWKPYFEKKGHRFSIVDAPPIDSYRKRLHEGLKPTNYRFFLENIVTRFVHVLRAPWHDVIFFRKGLIPYFQNDKPRLERLLYKLNDRIIFDDYDANFMLYESLVRGFIPYCKHITITNEFQKGFYEKIHPSVSIMPILIDATNYRPRVHVQRDKLVLGWIGTTGSFAFFSLIEDALRTLYDRRPFRLKLIAAKGLTIPGLDVVSYDWSEEVCLRELQDFDIGLFPCSDIPKMKGKVSTKVLQYMAAGLPSVCSPIGVPERIQDGINGFIVDSDGEWIEKLGLLMKDRDLRERIGKEARKTLLEYYSHDGNFRELYRWFQWVAESG